MEKSRQAIIAKPLQFILALILFIAKKEKQHEYLCGF